MRIDGQTFELGFGAGGGALLVVLCARIVNDVVIPGREGEPQRIARPFCVLFEFVKDLDQVIQRVIGAMGLAIVRTQSVEELLAQSGVETAQRIDVSAPEGEQGAGGFGRHVSYPLAWRL